eukprot:m.308522 g.308522  ORF g.308522 m.308522 type:complete len:418 (+) comp44150_c0_seq1:161-1414(+)
MAASENTMANVPTWSRPGLGGRGRSVYPKQLPRDKLKPLASSPASAFLSSGRKMECGPSLIANIRSADRQTVIQMMEEARKRILQQEKDMTFLTAQHKDVMKSLHQEIARLKTENKDLQFKLIMSKEESAAVEKPEKRLKSVSPRNGSKEDIDLKTHFLENELHDLRAALKEELERNSLLTKQLNRVQQQQHQQEQQQRHTAQLSSSLPPPLPGSFPAIPGQFRGVGFPVARPVVPTSHPPYMEARPMLPPNQHGYPPSGFPPPVYPGQRPPHRPLVPHYTMNMNGGGGVDNSLQIVLPGQHPRPPSLAECEAIIRYQQQMTDEHKLELESVKSDMRDLLENKWTPEAFFQAKRYFNREPAEFSSYRDGAKSLQSAVPLKESVSLPPLKPNLENRAVERQKRQQAVHKERIRREVLH